MSGDSFNLASLLGGVRGGGGFLDRTSNYINTERLRGFGTMILLIYFGPTVILVGLVRMALSRDLWWKVGFVITALPTILLLLKQLPTLLQGDNKWTALLVILGTLVLLYLSWPLVFIILAAPAIFVLVKFIFNLQLNWMLLVNGWVSSLLPANVVSDLKTFYSHFGDLFKQAAATPKF